MSSLAFISNSDGKFKKLLNELTGDSQKIYFATAFASMSGFQLIKPALEKMIEGNGSARFLFDISQGMTSPELIEELSTFPGDIKVKICINDKEKGFLHSKVYIFHGDKDSLIVGSNNFSKGGLLSNNEAALYVSGAGESVFQEAKLFFTDVWNSKFSIDPTVHPEIFETYRNIHDSWKADKFTKDNYESLLEISDKIEALNSDENYENTNLDIQYLLGATAANIGYQDKADCQNGKFILKYKSQLFNSNQPAEKGYITNIVNGERLGGIRISQSQTLKKYVQDLRDQIATFVTYNDHQATVELVDKPKTSTINLELKLQFRNENPVWTSLSRYVDLCHEKSLALKKMVPIFPQTLNQQSPRIGMHFVQGYMDFRSRISQADKVSSKLRIGVQVDKNATKFLYKFAEYLEKKHQHTVNVNDGSARNKDNMLRITATDETAALFQSTWQKRMNMAFAEYNQRSIP